ncbi:MAG: DUF1292 domain-containing protein [Candidatus Sericytochromatia bacterium]|nr:DUF1292 domain-containing protein [Candidatus Sericytochromatia bacterium]
MEQELEADDGTVTLVDEDGVNFEFQVVDIVEVEGKEYALLLPADADESEDQEVLVMRLEGDAFVTLEDEAEFQLVVKKLEEFTEDEEG